jgi:hypothetical protein
MRDAISTKVDAGRPLRTAQDHGEEVVHGRGFDWLARSGFVARGLIYGIIGVLAVQLALGEGDGKATDQQGALQEIADQPFGRTLLTIVAVGLGGYALWRLLRAAIGHGPEASDSGVDRVAGAASGIAYAILCVTAVKILSGSSTSGAGQPQKPAAGVLDWPAGPWLVGGAGAILVGVALYQGYRGLSLSFLDDSKTDRMSRGGQRAFTTVGVVGHLARMVVFGLVGYFLIKAAVEYSPSQAVGLDGALARLQYESYGPVLLGVVAAGLVAFAVYSVADARYRRL